MSSSTIMDSFDAPMLDYSGDMDVHMHTTASSPKPWAQSEAIMEEDVRPIHLPNPFPSHLPQQDVEIDMDDYYNENVEYEMADGELAVPDTELVDIDVYDAPREEAFSASAPISHSTGLTNQDPARRPAGDNYPPSDSGVATDRIPGVSNLEPPLRKSAELELFTPTLPQATVVQDRGTKSSDQPSTVAALQASAPLLEAISKNPRSDGEASAAPEGHVDSPGINATDGTSNNVDSFQPFGDSEQQRGPECPAAEHESSASVLQPLAPGTAIEETSHQVEIQGGESFEGVQSHNEGDIPRTVLDSTEAGKPEHPAPESHEAGKESNADPHEISEGVYIEPPPPVLIELPSTSDQPVCTLFNAPVNLDSDDTEVNVSSTEAPYTILLHNRPTLYYETLNEVFDALREEERIRLIAEFVDGEMVIDAYDLQLVVSEDNVHAHEISLHDLNVLHHGLGLFGPLRLRLRTVLSRFIQRYRSLQGQVTQLNVAGSASHPAGDSDEQGYDVGPSLEKDSSHYQAVVDDVQTERELAVDIDHEGLTEGDVDEQEDVESTYYGNAEYQGEHEEETYDESEQYADPQAHEDEAGAREDTGQVIASNESESVPDADPTHEGSADPGTTEYQENDDGYEEDGVSGDVEATSTITASSHAGEYVFPSAELNGLTEVPESGATGDSPQFKESEERQALNTELSSSASVHGDEEVEADGLTEDAEAEAGITGDESSQSTDRESNPAVVTNDEEQGVATYDYTGEYGAQEVELTIPATSVRGELSEAANPYYDPAEEDEENAESWELDDGYAVGEETVDGDEFDTALVGVPDSVSTGSSTLSGKTASLTSKRSYDEVDESEHAVEESSLQNSKKTRTR